MSARDFYAQLGITLPGNGATGSVSVRCFANPSAHKHDDRHPSCSVNLETGQWKCFSCGESGGGFDAAVAVGLSRSEAAELAKRHNLFAGDRDQSRSARPRATSKPRAASALPTEAQVAAWHEALVSNDPTVNRLGELRGWTSDAIEELELGIDGERITFPIRDAELRLVSLLRYAPNSETRKGRKAIAAKGAPRDLFPPPETLPAGATVYLVEGEADAVAMRSIGLYAVAVPGARGWKPEWAARFAGRDVVLVPDLDAEGRDLMAQAARDLLPHAASVRVVDMDANRADGGDVGDVVRDAAQDGANGLSRARRLIERAAAAADVLTVADVEPPAERGRTVTFTAASEIRDEPVRWLWRGRVPLGAVTVLAGQQGLGKSTTVIELAARLSRGDLDGDLAGKPAVVLIATLEDHLSIVKSRLRAGGADLDRVQIVTVEFDGLDELVTLPDDIRAIEKGIGEHDARLLIVDPIVAALSGSIDAYRDHEVRRAFAPLAKLAERRDLAVIAVMHLTKAQTGDLLSRVSGSVGFTGAARSVLAFARDPDDPDGETGYQRAIVHIKTNWGRLAPTLLGRIEECDIDCDQPALASRLVILGESPLTAEDFAGGRQDGGDRAEREAAADLIAVELEDGSWHPAGDIERTATANKISRSTLYRAARTLQSDGLLERERSGFPPRSMWRYPRSSQSPETNGQPNAWHERETLVTTGDLVSLAPRSSHVIERETNGANEVIPEAAVFDLFRREFDAIELTDDCINPLGHARHHEPHPDTGRTVCGLCHTPAAVLTSNGGRP